jgi:hypothetical protein
VLRFWAADALQNVLSEGWELSSMSTLRYDVLRSHDHLDEWIAQATGSDGQIFRAIFDYADAKERAEEYAAWMNGRVSADPRSAGTCRN